MNLFLKDSKNDEIFSWDFLINDINISKNYNPYCKSENYYQLFKHIIISMIIGKEVILLDYNFTNSELLKLTGFSNFDKFTKSIDRKKIPLNYNKDQLIKKLQNTSDKWKVTLFTSGTTGIPKKVTHNFNSISRFVKISDRNKKNIWGFAYNPSHMAGVQVFLQALLNGNSIIRIFDLSPNIIYKEIKENRISHISATPTFYKLLMPCKEVFKSITRITTGGEKFNQKIMNFFSEVFPNAKITNVYASTEAGTLFASENEIFSIKSEFEHLIRVVNNELLINSSLVGDSDINIKEWYNTEDLIEVISKNPLKFRFISRKSDMINVGGYKVNPQEVEDVILSFPGIKNARVFSKDNSVLGSIICCEVIRENTQINESTIRVFLQSKIQEFKIPRVISFVEVLSTTRTGKIKRN